MRGFADDHDDVDVVTNGPCVRLHRRRADGTGRRVARVFKKRAWRGRGDRHGRQLASRWFGARDDPQLQLSPVLFNVLAPEMVTARGHRCQAAVRSLAANALCGQLTDAPPGAEASVSGLRLLHLAAANPNDNVELVAILLQAGADLTTRDAHGGHRPCGSDRICGS
eukprot:SAG11_NODE_4_length_33019_cov_28.098909_18_plen_167_part_00